MPFRMSRTLPVLALIIFAFAAAPGARGAADISGAMTGDYLLQCQRNQNACQDFTNQVLQVLTAAARLGQGRIYKGCAPLPLGAVETGQLVQWILSRPQQATGYAADDIGTAAEALWPCR